MEKLVCSEIIYEGHHPPVEVQQHSKHRDQLHLVLLVLLLQELKQHVLEVDEVHRPGSLPVGTINQNR